MDAQPTSGMKIGYEISDGQMETEHPVELSPSMLKDHYARFGANYRERSEALVTDILTLYNNTTGPTIVLDAQGGNLSDAHMQAHLRQFGVESLQNDVIHFPIPEIMPGFAPFRIESETDTGVSPNEPAQRIIDSYQRAGKLLMGEHTYHQSLLATSIISALITVLFERNRGDQRYNPDGAISFCHDELEATAQELQDAIQSEQSDPFPEIKDDQVRSLLSRVVDSGDTAQSMKIMDGVYNRLDQIRQDKWLHDVFNNTDAQFEFKTHLTDDVVILLEFNDSLRTNVKEVLADVAVTNLVRGMRHHDGQHCTEGHDSIETCRAAQAHTPESHSSPLCRSPWGDNHVINLILNGNWQLPTTDFVDRSLTEDGSNDLSIGISADLLELADTTDKTSLSSILQRTSTALLGQTPNSTETARIFTEAVHELTTDDLADLLSERPPDEWLVELPHAAETPRSRFDMTEHTRTPHEASDGNQPELTADDVEERIQDCPDGEWLTKHLDNPESSHSHMIIVKQLETPYGHPSSSHPLSEQERSEYETAVSTIHSRMRDRFGL